MWICSETPSARRALPAAGPLVTPRQSFVFESLVEDIPLQPRARWGVGVGTRRQRLCGKPGRRVWRVVTCSKSSVWMPVEFQINYKLKDSISMLPRSFGLYLH